MKQWEAEKCELWLCEKLWEAQEEKLFFSNVTEEVNNEEEGSVLSEGSQKSLLQEKRGSISISFDRATFDLWK